MRCASSSANKMTPGRGKNDTGKKGMKDCLVADGQLARPPQVSGHFSGIHCSFNSSSTRASSSRPNCWLRRDRLRRATARSSARPARYHPLCGEALRFNSRHTVLRSRPSCRAISARLNPHRAQSRHRASFFGIELNVFHRNIPSEIPQKPRLFSSTPHSFRVALSL